jgi:cell division protein FtsB
METPRSDMDKPRLWGWIEALRPEQQPRLIIGGGVGCFLLLSVLAMVGERGYFEVYEFGRHLERVESRIGELAAENKRLQMQVTSLRADPYQVEKLAREDLGLARPDELIFEIVDQPADAK